MANQATTSGASTGASGQNPANTSPGAGAGAGGGGGADAGGAGGKGKPSARLANSQEVAMIATFLIVLTVLLLYNIAIRWPVCELSENINAENRNDNANRNANANTPANANAAANANASTNANTNTNANANANANARANRNANQGGNSNQTGTQGQQQATDQNQSKPILLSVEPGSGDIRGDKSVVVRGKGLASKDVIKFDQLPATPVGESTSQSMTVMTPPHSEGAVDVSLERDKVPQAVLPAAYKYVCPAPSGTSLFYMLVMAGMLGGCIHALRSLYWYVGNEELRVPWLPMYFILPFTGAAMAMLFSLLVVAGIVDNTTGRSTSLFIIAIAGLVGMFSQQAALKLNDVANAFFTKPGPGKGAHAQESQSVGAGKPPGPATPVAGIAPTFGPSGGGTQVIITNTGFTDVKSVTFGGVAATNVQFDKAASAITAVTPAHAPGDVEVVVTNAADETTKLRYTYTPQAGGGGAATAPKIDPPAGPSAGGQSVNITGTGFSDVAAVLFGGTASATAPAISADKSTITATTPKRDAGPGTVNVEIKNNAGVVVTLNYEYQ